MKLWRKLAKKENGVRNGRMLRNMHQFFATNKSGVTPFLAALFERAGIKTDNPAKRVVIDETTSEVAV
jgi:hypothetical protein